MVSQQYTRNFIIAEFAAEVLNEAAALMVEEQYKEASGFFQVRTGSLMQSLSGKPYSVNKSGQTPTLIFAFAKHIRFLDLSKTAKGKRKQVYRRIYNRFFFGYIYGYAYKRLRYGLSQGVRQELLQRMVDSGFTVT